MRKKNSKIVGGGIQRNRYNHRNNLIGIKLFISHFRYTNYIDNSKTHKQNTLTINGHDIVHLQQGQYLNDIIIDYGVRKHIHKNNQSILPLSTQYYTKLQNKGPSGVKNWLKSNIFKRKLILLPIHVVNHLSLCVIFMPSHDKRKANIPPQIQHMDSTRIHNTNQIINTVRKWIQSEWEITYPTTPLPTRYTVSKFPKTHPKVSQQTNGYDCGVYICRNTNITIKYLYTSINKELEQNTPDYTIQQHDINQLRIYIIEDIFKRQVHHHQQTSELTTHQHKQPFATHPIKQDITQNQHQPESISNTVHGIATNQAKGRSQLRLNKIWQQIFPTALQPPSTTNKNTQTQFPMRKHTALLKPATNDQIGTPMTEVHDNLRIWSVNVNTLLLWSGLAELYEI